MKAVVYNILSDSFTIRSDYPIPVPGNDEIRVKCLATALNPVDAKVAQWKLAVASEIQEMVLGLDVCGIVDAVGSEVTTFSIGDYVLYHGRMLKPHGGFAEYSIHDALTTVNLGKSLPLDAVTLAATPCAAWTAYRALYDKLLIPKPFSPSAEARNDPRTLCIIGASGGVGSFATQLAYLSGVQKIIAVCSGKHEEYVTKLGAHQVIDYRTESSIHDGLQRVTHGEGVDMILDCVGSATTNDAIRSLKFDGMVCPIVSFAEGDLNGFLNSFVYCQVSLGAAHGRGIEPRKRLISCGREVTSLVVSNNLQVPVTKVIELEQVPNVLKSMLSANNTGKIVLKL